MCIQMNRSLLQWIRAVDPDCSIRNWVSVKAFLFPLCLCSTPDSSLGGDSTISNTVAATYCAIGLWGVVLRAIARFSAQGMSGWKRSVPYHLPLPEAVTPLRVLAINT